MNPFLKQVAAYLYQNHQPELSDYCLVFPGRRAGVFFTAYLNEMVESPMIAPEITTISELISSLSGLHQAETVELVLKLQEVYSQITGHIETFDEFFFWGEILLADFDDVDKYLLNADDLFRNISDLKELEGQFDYLTAEQKRAIEEFWGNLDKVPHSFNKEKFVAIWVKLAGIYHRFRDVLKQNQIAYSGMIYREVAENLDEKFQEKLRAKKYVFIGFNALNECERTIFRKLDKQKRAIFFWDFDEFYLEDKQNEAGRFLRTNLVSFPAPWNFIPEKSPAPGSRKITLVSVPGNVTQAQAINIPQVLKSFRIDHQFDNTAFVLADENLLIPVVSAVGNHFPDINITMGYPFTNTPVYGFISQLVNLQKNLRKSGESKVFYHKPVMALLNHQFVVNEEIKSFISGIYKKNKVYLNVEELCFNPFLSKIFSCPEDWRQFFDYLLEALKEISLKFELPENESSKLEAEYLFQAYLAIQRLKDTLEGLHLADFPMKILFRLVDQSLKRISIPFEGEPLTGLQIMGLLETRCLDFRNMVLFSANEGFLPRISAGHSFVPYNLRKGFGMPTYEDRDAMYAYYFYRLIQRNEKTVIVYNSITEGVATSEPSRFIFQLMYDSSFEVETLNLSFNFKANPSNPIQIEASENHIRKLLSDYSERNLSPSAINTYLDCKLKFYFKYLAGIKEKEELKEEIDAVLFGNLFHYAVELLYKPFENQIIEAERLKSVKSNRLLIDRIIKEAIAVKYYRMAPDEVAKLKLGGQNILIASHLRDYILQMLENDIQIAPFRVVGLEKEVSAIYTIDSEGIRQQVKIGGIIDRIDQTAEGLRVVDYKTGRNLELDFKDWTDLVDRNHTKRRKEIFQTLIYSDIVSKTGHHPVVMPAIYKLDQLFDEEFVPNIKFQNEKLVYQSVANEFTDVLSNLLSEIFSTNNVYDQTADSSKCSYCPYNKICRR
jgi:CRISPR/Cas system-associated exonuclease Cas4 (RecB family)